ncbi:ASCH domain-containing protein [Dellaglioa sp. P0083]|uniref:ASCH domain-containing protein n=1 Tax=Dellaglioa kimchii TaxID=3344667 RepID=UPI0038D3E59A
MTIYEYWQAFKKVNKIEHDNYDAWSFGVTKKETLELGQLVLDGLKTGTSSAYNLYFDEEPLPKVGDYNVIVDYKDNPMAITKTTKVYVTPFNEVTEEHAFLEGEGDRNLAYWRSVHQSFFEEELESVNKTFDETMPVVCEEFELVFPIETTEV